MATDGFWELIEDEEMVKCLKKSCDVHDWVRRMEKIIIMTYSKMEIQLIIILIMIIILTK